MHIRNTFGVLEAIYQSGLSTWLSLALFRVTTQRVDLVSHSNTIRHEPARRDLMLQYLWVVSKTSGRDHVSQLFLFLDGKTCAYGTTVSIQSININCSFSCSSLTSAVPVAKAYRLAWPTASLGLLSARLHFDYTATG